MTGPDADAMAPQDCQDDDLLARESTHGWHVVDRSGEIWYPSDEAAQKIAASPNPGATALAICRDDPMRGAGPPKMTAPTNDDPGAPDTTTRAGYLRALRWARGLAASFDDRVSHGHGIARAITEDIDAEITRVEREGKS